MCVGMEAVFTDLTNNNMNDKEDILNEWLTHLDTSSFEEGHYNCILQAMEEYAQEKVKNSSIPLVSETFMSKLSDKKNMMYKEIKKTVDVEYFSFIGGWTTAIDAMKALGEKIYSR